MPAIKIEGDGPDGPDDSDLEFSPRGFALYGSTETTYGDTVRVYESSSAEGPHVWLAVDPREEGKSAHAHLSLEQAEAIRDQLSRAIDRGRRIWGVE